MTDWTTDAADKIESVVGTIRDKTVVPAQTVTRAVVFGLLAGFFALTALVLLSLLVFRVLSFFLSSWAAWLILGGIFVLAGALLWAKRSPPKDSLHD